MAILAIRLLLAAHRVSNPYIGDLKLSVCVAIIGGLEVLQREDLYIFTLKRGKEVYSGYFRSLRLSLFCGRA